MFESPVYALYSRLFEKNEQQNTEQNNENKKKKLAERKTYLVIPILPHSLIKYFPFIYAYIAANIIFF